MTFNYDYQEKINELKDFLQKQGLKLLEEKINIVNDIDNCYCQLTYKYDNKIINVHLKACNDKSLSIFYSYWHSENKISYGSCPIVEYSIIEIPAEKELFLENIKQSFNIFKRMLNIYFKYHKEIKNDNK